jgi:hypothetical protein
MEFEVDTEEVRAAARSMLAAGDGLAGITPHADLDPVGAAMPGSLSAAAVETLASAWRCRFEAVAAATVRHGETLARDADDYDEADADVDRALQP